jgi:hypothetical protein
VGLTDRVNALTAKAKQTASEHKDELHRAAEQAKTMADKRTQGKYHAHIEKAAAKVDALLDKLPDHPNEPPADDGPASTPEPE